MTLLLATFHWLTQPEHWLGDEGILLRLGPTPLLRAGQHGRGLRHCPAARHRPWATGAKAPSW